MTTKLVGGQPGRGGNKSDAASHRLQHQYRVGRTRAFVLFVGILYGMHPIFGARSVARRVVDQFEFAVPHVIIDRFRSADADQIQAQAIRSQAIKAKLPPLPTYTALTLENTAHAAAQAFKHMTQQAQSLG